MASGFLHYTYVKVSLVYSYMQVVDLDKPDPYILAISGSYLTLIKRNLILLNLTLSALKQVLSGCISNTEISRAGV